jgi:hypothetical protein
LEYENTNLDYFKGLYTLSCFLLLSFLGLITEGALGKRQGEQGRQGKQEEQGKNNY